MLDRRKFLALAAAAMAAPISAAEAISAPVQRNLVLWYEPGVYNFLQPQLDFSSIYKHMRIRTPMGEHFYTPLHKGA